MHSIFSHIRGYLFFTLLTLISFSANALHIKGGWMSYRFLGRDSNGNLQYEFTVKVFRDCGPQNPGQNDMIINITLFRNGDNNNSGTFAASLVRNYSLRKTSFNSCISPVPDVCYVILEYKGNATVPPSAQGYTAAFQRCCRIDGIRNVSPPSNSLGNTYTIQLPGTQNSNSNVENASPIFAENDTAVVCFNNNLTLDFSATDPDGDSLVYEFAPALSGASSGSPAPVIPPPPPYNPVPYSSGFTADNPFGTNMVLDTRSGIITGPTPSGTGEYVVAVKVKEFRNGIFIAETRKELHVNVANCSVPDADLPQELINCDDFQISPENRSMSPIINSYFWDFGRPGTPGNTTDIVRPTFIYPDTGTYTLKLVVNRGQPCSDSTTMKVRIYPGFAPGFIADGSCFINPFQFRDTTFARYGTPNSWRWDFGNTNATNDTSILRNPSYTYPQPGTYTVTLRATSNKGCAKTVNVPVQVSNRPSLTLPFRDTLICSIDSLMLRAVGTGTFSWTPASGRIINASSPTPTVFPLDTTTYRVTLNDRGCIAVDSIRVNVLQFISVDAGKDTTICRSDPVTLMPVTAGLSFLWSPSNVLNNPSIRNPVAIPTGQATRFVVIANLGKCQATDSVTVTTVPYPEASAMRDTSICFGTSIQLRATANGTRIQWIPATGLSNPVTLEPIASPIVSTRYTLNVFDNQGCPKPGLADVNVTVIPPVTANAGRDTSIVAGQLLQLSASSNASQFVWSPSLGISNPNILSPTLRITAENIPPGINYFLYTFTASTPEGCSNKDSILIRIFSTGPSVFVPNAFTPNNDGLNDVIRPILAGIERLEFFRIYNRFGQLVFETNLSEAGWDGRIKGKPQGSGNFVYRVQARDFTGEIIKQSGSFLLIR